MILNAVDLNKLRVFISVMKNHGYRGASEELNLTRSALSQSISILEGQIGQKLFLRSGNRLHPTPHALQFSRELTGLQTQLEQAFAQLTEKPNLISGTIKIGAYYEFSKMLLVPVIDQFLRSYPLASLKLRFEAPSKLERLLSERKIDLAISIFPQKLAKSIATEKLFQQELVMIAAKGSAFILKTRQNFLEAPLVDYFAEHILARRWMNHFFSVRRYDPQVKIFAASSEMVVHFVLRDIGIGVVPRYVAEPYLKSGELKIVSPNSDRLIDYIWLNRQQDAQPHSIEMAFIKTLKENL